MSEKEEKAKVATFNQVMTMEEAQAEKQKGTPVGESLKRADSEYQERRRKK